MAPPGDEDRPWAHLAAVYEKVQKEADIDAAIRRVVGGYSNASFKHLYRLTERWGPTFAKRYDGEERDKRFKLVNYILGPANRRR